ncbi:hypothetical protein V6N13_059203 [Hibiscus sabdariffa]|uniref:Uncharacterized protein n=1 Tax=Hibiscus sabdariffa TaxID=183260 RepID=A0ABR2GDQ1_9ROSI
MESQTTVNKESKNPSSCSSGRRSSHSSSLEFEFWMVRNPYFPQPDLISADELFFNGILRPLHLLPSKQPEENPPASELSVPDPEPEPSPLITFDPTPALSSSKRWKDIFKKEKSKNGAKNQQDKDKEKERKKKKKKKEKKSQNQSRGCPVELHINIWPFSRSRSAGTSGTRPRTVGARKVSSAPCSCSNSSGESKSRKGPSNPSRAGVHLGRSCPVWQVRRSGSAVKNSNAMARTADKCSGKKEITETRRGKTGNGGNANKNNRAKVLHLKVPMRIGSKHHLKWNRRIDDNNTDPSGDSCGNGRNSGNNIFSLRNLFSKKVYQVC